ncbi:hypothetical protein THRCLA_04656 [Thraustotheca clavata]|uniref:Uncharacterized protein n=1 Tax=Thraustotheca clavata TaxID=74557 RepID=A0A1V9ZYD8_9STRA|nr:hypothetical protein THRCLA_04656 [Thraustotheca clavata]
MERGYLQQQAASLKFVDSRANSRTPGDDCRVEKAIATGSTKEFYDPEHPDADWGGFVPRTHKKRAFKDPVSVKDHLVHGQDAILPAITKEKPLGRKTFEHNINHFSVDPAAKGTPFHTGVHQTGPGGEHNCNNWKTSYEHQTAPTTSRDPHVPGKVRDLTQQPHKRHFEPLKPINRLPPLTQNQAKLPRGGSILVGIGQKLASSTALADQQVPLSHLPTSYSSQKTLDAENRHTVLLGYTGHRK